LTVTIDSHNAFVYDVCFSYENICLLVFLFRLYHVVNNKKVSSSEILLSLI
jgi:hypothetical protein